MSTAVILLGIAVVGGGAIGIYYLARDDKKPEVRETSVWAGLGEFAGGFYDAWAQEANYTEAEEYAYI